MKADTTPYRIENTALATARRVAAQEGRTITAVISRALELYASMSDSEKEAQEFRNSMTARPDDWHRLTDDLDA